jgi:hypothetical protein
MWEPICKNVELKPQGLVEAGIGPGARDRLSSNLTPKDSVLSYYKIIYKDFFCTRPKVTVGKGC